MYIRATGNISPQESFGHGPLLETPVDHRGNRLNCIEPDYKEFIDVKLIRRMSRIIKMGVAAASECLREATLKNPDAIVTGTAYGCLEDTGIFLGRMVEQQETLLAPTAFIQSTHNTIGAQIALQLQCNNYNNAFVHRGFSFESALLDAMLLLKEGDAQHVLVGAIDEITNASHAILTRMGLYRHDNTASLHLLTTPQKGTVAGEGAAFFVLANAASATDYARLDALHTFYKPAGKEAIEKEIGRFLLNTGVGLNDIDLIIDGRNGDARHDATFNELEAGLFKDIPSAGFKHLCGEYPTASAFALWLATRIIKDEQIPAVLNVAKQPAALKKILVYNNHLNSHHSLLLVSAC